MLYDAIPKKMVHFHFIFCIKHCGRRKFIPYKIQCYEKKHSREKNPCRFYRNGWNIRKNLEKLVNSVIKAIIAIPCNGR